MTGSALLLAFLMLFSRGDSDMATRAAAGRALRYLEVNGAAWMENKKCVSCHTVGMMIWTHNEARRRGFATDAQKLRNWNDWALKDLLARKDLGGGDTISQLILGRPRDVMGDSDLSQYRTLLASLASQQRPDGSWKPGPQLQHPPEVSTRWAYRALDSFGTALQSTDSEDLRNSITRARTAALGWLKAESPDDSLEARVLRMLMMRSMEPALAQIWLLELMALQNADGGWSYQFGAKESDAFATGLALYAAALQGHPLDNAQFKRAREFLIKTMKEDGSWEVRAANIRSVADGKETKGADAIYSYWGTAWAALGLLHTFPESPAATQIGVKESGR